MHLVCLQFLVLVGRCSYIMLREVRYSGLEVYPTNVRSMCCLAVTQYGGEVIWHSL